MKSWRQVWLDADTEDRIKLVLLLVLYIMQVPLMIVFYIVRSAWRDAGMFGWWFRPKAICEHGVDRTRQPCEPCGEKEEVQMMSEFIPMNKN